MTEYWKGGKAKKAPYETSHSRIPLPIKDTVELLSQVWKRALSAGRDTDSLIAEIQECIRKWVMDEENPVTGKDETGQHLEVDKLKAEIEELREKNLQLKKQLAEAEDKYINIHEAGLAALNEFLDEKGKQPTSGRDWTWLVKFKDWLSVT